LIEDASIKRASGLLISITGGKDMTLFEVDEAATRIREEADPDANIIVGAIFDEGLEGIVRVSVVATGIDGTGAASQIQSGECDLKEIADKLRNENSRSREELTKYPGPATPQSVDPYRQPPANQNTIREDVLDIPAFLRRRAVGAARAIEY
jgi:cell division protein FtsZ